MKNVTFNFTIENNKGVTIGGKPYILTAYTGLGIPESVFQSVNYYGWDGEDTQSVRLSTREITITGRIACTSFDDLDTKKEYLVSCLLPKIPGELTINRGTSTTQTERVIKGYVESVTFDHQIGWSFQQFQIKIRCDNPYFKSKKEQIKELSKWAGGVKFPVKLPLTLAKRSGRTTTLENDGHADIPFKLIFEGPAKQPTFYNVKTGQYIKVNTDLVEGDTLEINTEEKKETVQIIRAADGQTENAYNYIDPKSALDMILTRGDNILRYENGYNDIESRVALIYRKYYLIA
jgi:hypothetical protein